MGEFSQSLEGLDKVHSLSDIELENLRLEYNRIRLKAETGEEITLEEQRTVIQWMRADRETKFILNQKPIKEKKVKIPKEPKPPKPKKRKKLTKKEFNAILLKELKGEELSPEEIEARDLYIEKLTFKGE